MQYPAQQQQYGGMSRPAYQAGGWNNRVRPVSSIDEVRAASIDFDGSVFYFPDLANKKIYTKQINMDGTAQLNMYELQEMPVSEQQIQMDPNNFITRVEFEDTINWVKKYLEDFTSASRESAAAAVQVSEETKTEVPKPRSFNF